MHEEEILEASGKLLEVYKKDLDLHLENEINRFKNFYMQFQQDYQTVMSKERDMHKLLFT